MIQAPKSDAICMGISIEGDHLRLAAIGREGKSLRVLSLAECTIPVATFVPAAKGDTSDVSSNPFENADTTERNDVDFSAVREFLANHYLPGASLALSLGEPYIRTFLMPGAEKDNSAKIVKRILAEVQQSMNIESTKDRVAYNMIGKSGIIAAIRLESAPIIEACSMPFGSQRRSARIDFLTSNDIALINLVRVHFRFQEHEVVHVINVGRDDTRLYILQGYDLKFIAPTIQQGANDRDYVMMLNNRIELAAENAGFPKANAVVLCGYAEEIGLKDEILANSPSMVTHSLGRLRLSHGGDEAIQREMRHYPVPISIAWQKLEKENPHFYRMNLLPQRIREGQKKLKLAWHGFILLAIMFAAVAGLTVLGMKKQVELSRLTATVEYEKKQVREQQAIVDQINALESRSANIITATNTLDTLLLNSEKWSETLDTLALGVSNLQNIWIHEFKPEKDGNNPTNAANSNPANNSVIGFSLTRGSVPALSHRIGQTNMREISVQKIGERKVFRYDVNLAVPDLYPYSGSIANVWHDSVGTALGPVNVRISAPAPQPEQSKAPAKKPKGSK
jgi:hypothetical protein